MYHLKNGRLEFFKISFKVASAYILLPQGIVTILCTRSSDMLKKHPGRKKVQGQSGNQKLISAEALTP